MRILHPNLAFEEELICDSFKPKSGTLQALIELAPLMAWAADQDDICVVPELPSGLPASCPASFRTSIADHSTDNPAGELAELIPWGWTDHVLRFSQSKNSVRTMAPDLAAVHRINTRSFLHPFDQYIDLAGSTPQPFSCLCRSIEDVMFAVKQMEEFGWSKWVAKPELSHAGRNRLMMTGGDFNDQQAGWLNRFFRKHECVSLEPWVHLVQEGSLHFDLLPAGSEAQIRYIGMTGLLNDQAGRYRGSFLPCMAPEEMARKPASGQQSVPQLLVDHGMKICEAACREAYFGPVGLDFFLFEGPNGNLSLRLCNDLNGRWTMGRLSLAIADKIGATAAFRWEHFVAGNSQNLDQAIQKCLTKSGIPTVDILRTSPEHVGGRNVRLGSAAIWGTSDHDVRMAADHMRKHLTLLQTENSPQ